MLLYFITSAKSFRPSPSVSASLGSVLYLLVSSRSLNPSPSVSRVAGSTWGTGTGLTGSGVGTGLGAGVGTGLGAGAGVGFTTTGTTGLGAGFLGTFENDKPTERLKNPSCFLSVNLFRSSLARALPSRISEFAKLYPVLTSNFKPSLIAVCIPMPTGTKGITSASASLSSLDAPAPRYIKGETLAFTKGSNKTR